MKLRLTINTLLFWTLLYPVLLFFPSLFSITGFGVTAPYFFILFTGGLLFLGSKSHIRFPVATVLIPVLILVLVSLINFSSLRYSLPVFFTVYLLVAATALSAVQDRNINFNLLFKFLLVYLVLSVPFLFLPQGYIQEGRFTGFVGSPTIYSGFMSFMFVLISARWKIFSLKFLAFYGAILGLVFLTKTRLLIVFMLLYPFLLLFLEKSSGFRLKLLFLIFFGVTFLIYPFYNLVIAWFPELVSLRYKKSTDSSFELRNYLYLETKAEFFDGTFWQKLLGKGNEFARTFVYDLLQIDLMPHNDFMRILLDWGLVGFAAFFYLLYRLGAKNKYTLLICLIYLVLFYSNTVFNLFLFSLILIFYFGNTREFSGTEPKND